MSFVKKQKFYFTAFVSLIVVAIIGRLQMEKGDLILYFEGERTVWKNYFFKSANLLAEGYAFLFVFFTMLCFKYRYALTTLIAGFSVMLISLKLKNYFSHVRPGIYFTEIVDTPIQLVGVPEIEILKSYTTSFPSGHTMAAFTLYTLLVLYFPKNKYWHFCCLMLATFAALARVYLAQHFLEDIIVGAVVGYFIAVAMYILQAVLLQKYPFWNRGLFSKN